MLKALLRTSRAVLRKKNLTCILRAQGKLHSEPFSRQSAIRIAYGCLMSDMDGQTARLDEYFEQFYMVDPPSGQLSVVELQIEDANPCVHKILF